MEEHFINNTRVMGAFCFNIPCICEQTGPLCLVLLTHVLMKSQFRRHAVTFADVFIIGPFERQDSIAIFTFLSLILTFYDYRKSLIINFRPLKEFVLLRIFGICLL